MVQDNAGIDSTDHSCINVSELMGFADACEPRLDLDRNQHICDLLIQTEISEEEALSRLRRTTDQPRKYCRTLLGVSE